MQFDDSRAAEFKTRVALAQYSESGESSGEINRLQGDSHSSLEASHVIQLGTSAGYSGIPIISREFSIFDPSIMADESVGAVFWSAQSKFPQGVSWRTKVSS